MSSRFDGTLCERCRQPLEFRQPPGVTVSKGEQVDVWHGLPWCSYWANPITRNACIPKAILDECETEAAS